MSPVLEATKTNLVRVLRKTIGLFDRGAALRERGRLQAAHEAAVAERATGIATGHAVWLEWRSPELRLRRLQVEAAQAARVESFAAGAIDATLRDHPPTCVQALVEYIRRTYQDLNRRPTASSLRPIGEALVNGTMFCRDEGWRLPEAEAADRCRALRDEIEAALVKVGRAPDEEEGA